MPSGRLLIANLGTTEVHARAYRPGYNESGIAVAAFMLGLPGALEASPANALAFAGTMGGPFTSPAAVYTLTNSGGLPVTWSVATSQNWLAPSIAGGTLAGGTAANVAFSVNANGDSLPAGSHNAVATFTNSTSGTQISRSVSLTVNPIVISVGQFNAAAGTFELTIQGHSNSTYVIEASINLNQWSAIATNVGGSDGLWTFVETNTVPQRFYRGKPQR